MLAKDVKVHDKMREQAREVPGPRHCWRWFRFAVAVLGVSALVAGCGIFGCAGSATNGGAFGGCGAGMRF